MNNWLTVFLYELRDKFRSKAYLFVTFGLPLLAVAVFYGYQAARDQFGSSEDQPLESLVEQSIDSGEISGYVDLTPQGLFPPPDSYPQVQCTLMPGEIGRLTASVVKRVTSPYCLPAPLRAYPSRAAGLRALDNGEITTFYVIEPDYVETGNVAIYLERFSIEMAESRWFEDFLLSSLLYQADPAAYEWLYLRLRDPAVIVEHRVSDTGATAATHEDRDFILVYGFGTLMMLSVFWGGGYLMQSVVQEKESRIIEIMLSSVRPTALLLGKILAMGLVALIQMSMLSAAFVFIASRAGDLSASLGDIEVEAGSLAIMVLYFLLGFLLFGSLMAAIGALSASMRESQNFITIVTLPAVIPFFFIQVFAEEPHGTLATALSMFPITAPISMIMRVAVADVAALELLLSLALLLAGVGGAIGLAGRLFRVNTLLRGNTPKLRDIPRLLRD